MPSLSSRFRIHRALTAASLTVATVLLTACKTVPVEQLRESADFYYTTGNYEQAAHDYGKIVEHNPGDWEAQYGLGRADLKLQKYADARRALEQAAALKPTNSDVADALAEAMYRQGDKNQLYAFLRERAQATQSVDVYLQLSEYALGMGDADSAMTAAETAIFIDEGRSTEPYLQAYAVSERIGDMDLAVRRLRQAYGINPEDRRVVVLLDDLGEVRGPTLALPPGR